MEIIAHTALTAKTKEGLENLIADDRFSKIELDFIPTKDTTLVWAHGLKKDNQKLNQTNYKDLSNVLTLDDVLEIVNNRKKLLIEIKHFIDYKQKSEELLKKLEQLRYTKDNVQIQSFNQHIIKFLLQNKENLKNVEIGLIINLFKTFNYRKGNIEGLENVDFVSLASELYEWPVVGEDYKLYRDLFLNSKQYAWTWDLVYKEIDKRLNNYIDKKVDGIITLAPELILNRTR